MAGELFHPVHQAYSAKREVREIAKFWPWVFDIRRNLYELNKIVAVSVGESFSAPLALHTHTTWTTLSK